MTSSHRNEISTWVATKSARLSATDGHLQETGNPPSLSLYERPIAFDEEQDFLNNANKRIADAMLDCWESFNLGETPFLGKDYNSGAFCFPCAQIKFGDSIKKDYSSLNNLDPTFTEFLNKPIYNKEGPTYMELFNGKAVIDPAIKKDKDSYIVFIASKGNLRTRLENSQLSLLNNIYWGAFAPGMDNYYPGLILASSETIQGVCNENFNIATSSTTNTKSVTVPNLQDIKLEKLTITEVYNSDLFGQGHEGAEFIIYDINTKTSFKASAINTDHYHIDAAPISAEDTQTIRDIRNFNGEFVAWCPKESPTSVLWERRPVLVHSTKDPDPNHWIAASVHGCPHGKSLPAPLGDNYNYKSGYTLKKDQQPNNYPGHFCVHFLNSKTHTDNIDPFHQKMINQAYELNNIVLAESKDLTPSENSSVEDPDLGYL